VVVTARLSRDGVTGQGECVPYARYGETPQSVCAQLAAVEAMVNQADWPLLDCRSLLPAGAARNALDCALIDWRAKSGGMRAWEMLGLPAPAPVVTAFTLSLAPAKEMESAARAASDRPLLKIKLGTPGDLDRLDAVRQGAPESALIVDANEGWTMPGLEALLPALAAARVSLVEQPLPAGQDDDLVGFSSPVPLCADESVHASDSIAALADRYQMVNLKLDKSGGLTEALAAVRAAQGGGLEIMVGCMVGTSLAMAPALLLTPFARYADLDGPLLLAADRLTSLTYEGSTLLPPPATLWG
jgi:L-Ala-D/L-Glu epimerase